jgi:hypothetical protein
LQGSLLSIPLLSRPLPPEVDDVYAYLNKTVQLKTCFFQDCPAVRDLQAQATAPSADPQQGWLRHRAHLRTIVVFHPLYSLVLIALNTLGLGWETAHNLLWLASIPLFGLAFALWLRTLWGAAPAGIALMLLAWQVFPDQGLNVVVPSNLAMIIAVMLWTRVLRHTAEVPTTILVGTCVLILMHPIGRIYAIMTLMLVFLIIRWPLSRTMWVSSASAAMVIGISFLLPSFVTQPVLRTLPDPYWPGLTWQDALLQTFTVAQNTVTSWASWQFPLFAGAFLGGLFACEPQRRRHTLSMTLVLFSFLLLSLFYLQPHYLGQPFMRLWVPVAVFMTGGIAQGLSFVLNYTLHRVADRPFVAQQQDASITDPSTQPNRAVSIKLLTIVLVVLLLGIGQFVPYHTSLLHAQITQRINYQNFALSPEQPAILETHATPEDKVLYHDEAFRDFYFTHGALAYGAVYTPIVVGTPQSDIWLNHADISFAVLFDPVDMMVGYQEYLNRGLVSSQGELAFSALESLQIAVEQPPSSTQLWVRVRNPGDTVQLTLQSLESETAPVITSTSSVEVPARWQGWISLPLDAMNQTTAWYLVGSPEQADFFISGLRFADKLQWPWQHKARLTLIPADSSSPVILSFDPTSQLPAPLRTHATQVLNDDGASVLVRLTNR